jgi:hypothetical protein
MNGGTGICGRIVFLKKTLDRERTIHYYLIEIELVDAKVTADGGDTDGS